MSNIKVILGESFDLDSYIEPFGSEYYKEKFPQCHFLGYRWRNISKDKIQSDNDKNAGVRAEGTPTAHDSLGQSFTIEGWNGKKRPPIEDENGVLKDGRTRRDELLYLGEKWMPVATIKFKESDTPNSLARATSIKFNDHAYHRRFEMKDFVVAVGRDINDGECQSDEISIRKHLKDVYKIDNYYNDKGIQSQIVNLILRKCQGSVGNTPEKREKLLDWISNITNQNVIGGILLKTGGNRDEQVITRHVLPNPGLKPDLILYADGYFAEDARQSVKDFINDVNEHYKNIFKVVNDTLTGQDLFTVNLQAPSTPCFNILGIIPTLETPFQKKAYELNRLLTLEEFLTK